MNSRNQIGLVKNLRLIFTWALLPLSSVVSAQDMGFSVWEVKNDSECRARMTFLGAKEYLYESGEQVATKSYKIKEYGNDGFHKFHMRTTSHNGLLNCAGKMGVGVGDRQDIFVLFNADNTEMAFYRSPKAEDSFNIVFQKLDP